MRLDVGRFSCCERDPFPPVSRVVCAYSAGQWWEKMEEQAGSGTVDKVSFAWLEGFGMNVEVVGAFLQKH